MRVAQCTAWLLLGLSPCQADYPHARYLLGPSASLSLAQQLDWAVGRSFARQAWVSAPASTAARDGLGPLFNANRCTSCHINNGQGMLPERGPGLILKLSPDSAVGKQLQTFALPGYVAEGKIRWQTRHQAVSISEQHTVSLRWRHYRMEAHALTAGSAYDAPVSARLAPALVGMGLIDRIDRAALRAAADPDDVDGDGISGRANTLDNTRSDTIGIFGWKAAEPSLRTQIAAAFAEDIGITSSQRQQQNTADGNPVVANDGLVVEISEKLLDAVAFYVANLALPPSQPVAPAAFFQAECHLCHQPRVALQVRGDEPQDYAYAYSDFLLHDMGPGLADSPGEGAASGAEWRTAPLWGLGLRSSGRQPSRLLHDGRATSIHQAILWHDGEAAASRRLYLGLTDDTREHLIQFLRAL